MNRDAPTLPGVRASRCSGLERTPTKTHDTTQTMEVNDRRTYQDDGPGSSYSPNNRGSLQLSYEEPAANVPDLFDVVANPRRRIILRVLDGAGSLELTTLSDIVAATEYETPVSNLSHQQQKRMYVATYQTHVPQLEDADVVECTEDNMVHPGEHFERIVCKLDAFTEAEPGDGEEPEPEPDGLLAGIRRWFS